MLADLPLGEPRAREAPERADGQGRATRSSSSDFGYLSLVDASASEPSIKLPETLKLLTVVDHHRPPAMPKAPFVDIRHDVGATCTIYAEYCEQGPRAVRRRMATTTAAVATAMFFGIQTDTDDFAYATPADFRAAAYLKPFCRRRDAEPRRAARA